LATGWDTDHEHDNASHEDQQEDHDDYDSSGIRLLVKIIIGIR
jgi:hypothetical protein